VTLGPEHEQPARIQHLLPLGRDLFLDASDGRVALGPLRHLAQLFLNAEVEIAA
jgi:hypothetical protein